MKGPASSFRGVIRGALWPARLAADALELGALAVTAGIAHLGARTLRRVNRRGLLGWGMTVLIVLLLTTAVVEVVELI